MFKFHLPGLNVRVQLLRLRRIFGPKRDQNGEWTRLHHEELHSLYRSPNIVRVIKSRRLRWAGHVARMEEGRSAFKILTGKPIEKRPLGRPRRRWEDNIRMDLEENLCWNLCFYQSIWHLNVNTHIFFISFQILDLMVCYGLL